jgi:hypothetical protein
VLPPLPVTSEFTEPEPLRSAVEALARHWSDEPVTFVRNFANAVYRIGSESSPSYSFLVFAEAWGFENLSAEQQSYFDFRRRLFRESPIWPAERP